MRSTSIRRRALNAIRQQILPCLQTQNAWRIALGEPPFNLPPPVTLHFHPGKPLTSAEAKHTYASPSVVRYWPRTAVHNNRFPYMGFILEGEMDWRIGITAQIAKRFGGEYSRSEYAFLGMPKGTFILMPPGIPFASGELAHWERSAAQNAKFQVFWMRVQPAGVQCHFSRNDGKGVVAEPNLYLPDSRLLPDAQALIEELRRPRKISPQIIHTLLLLISYRLEQCLDSQLAEDFEGAFQETHPEHSALQGVELACAYIESHYSQRLTLDAIAANAFVSQGHLCRLFKTAKGITINEYLTQFRLDYACQLLAGTSMRIKEIGSNVGYQNLSYFCQVFVRRFGCSPGEYRKKHQEK